MKRNNRSTITRGTAVSLFLLLCMTVLLYAENPQENRWLRVEFEGEGRSASLPAQIRKDVLYVSAAHLAEMLNARSVYVPLNRKLIITAGARSIKLTGANPFILVDQKAYQMPLPTLDLDGAIYVPLILFIKTVGDCFPEPMSFDNRRDVLTIRRTQYNITGLEVEEKLNGSLIRFVTTEPFKQADISVSLNNNWLYVTFNKGKVDSARMASHEQMGIVKQVMPFQFEQSVQISLQLSRKAMNPEVLVGQNEVTVSLRSPQSFDTETLSTPGIDTKKWLIDTIVLDPGHGGKDPGAIGRQYKTKEKEIVLDIAQRLQTLLKKQGLKVLMTREDDKAVSLSARTRFANTSGGKLYLSIHANGNPKSRVRGFCAYYLGQSNQKEKEALEIAQAENSVIDLEESQKAYKQYQDGSYILNAIAQSENQKESQDLARMINAHLKRRTQLPQFYKGVYQNWFYVLVGAAMPAVLVETAFLTNSYDEKFLRTRSNRQKIAQALCDAIMEFKEKYEKGIG